VRITGRVLGPDGRPLESGIAEVVTVDARGRLERLAQSEVARGIVEMDVELPAVWAVSINQQPVLTYPVSATSESVDLGEIALLERGLRAAVFHAPEGLVFAVPTRPPASTPSETPVRAVAVSAGLTFGGMVGSTARQLSGLTAGTEEFRVTGASVRVKGVPIVTDEAMALEFPNAELAASGAGLSELSFTLKGPEAAATTTTTTPSGLLAPSLLGYGRELALRKIAALGLFGDVSTVITDAATDAGRVVRQIPPPGDPVAPGSIIRLFIGKHGGA
jgi:hypothetical protein